MGKYQDYCDCSVLQPIGILSVFMEQEPSGPKKIIKKKKKASTFTESNQKVKAKPSTPPPQVDDEISTSQQPTQEYQQPSQTEEIIDADSRYQNLVLNQSQPEESIQSDQEDQEETKTISDKHGIDEIFGEEDEIVPKPKTGKWTKKDDADLRQKLSKFNREKEVNFPKAVPKEKDVLGLLNTLKKRAKTFEWKSDVETATPKLKPDRIVGVPTELNSRVLNIDSDNSDFELEVVQYIGEEDVDERLPLTQKFRDDSDEDMPSTQKPTEETDPSQETKFPKLRIETKSWENSQESKSTTPTSAKTSDPFFNGFESRGYRLAMMSKTSSAGTPKSQNDSHHSEEEFWSGESDEEKVSHRMEKSFKVHVAKQNTTTPTTPKLSSLSFDTDRFEMVDKKRKKSTRPEKSTNAVKFAKEYYQPNQNGIKKVGSIRLTKKKKVSSDEDD